MKKTITTLLILLIFSLSAHAEFEQENHVYKSFDVHPENNTSGSVTSYELQIKTWKWKLRKALAGKLEVKVPESFSLDLIADIQVQFSDTTWNYRVTSFETDGNKLWIYFATDKHCETCPGDGEGEPDNGDWTDWWHKYQIDVTINIDEIQNPADTGSYTFFFTGYDRHGYKKIGPIESKPFFIAELVTFVDSIAIIPSEDITLVAGDSVIFSAKAFDQFGIEVEGIEFEYSLTGCGGIPGCEGELVDSIYYALLAGTARVQVSGGGMTQNSGLITVVPNEFTTLDLYVYTEQYVGYPLGGSIILRDSYHNTITDPEVLAYPITLSISEGHLTPSILDDTIINDGSFDLQEYNIVYSGESALANITAESNGIESNSVFVSFNNYNIINVLDSIGSVLTAVEPDIPQNAHAVIINNGGFHPYDSIVQIEAYYQSNPLVKETTEHNGADITPETPDTVSIILPANTSGNATDELVVISNAYYLLGGSPILVSDTFITEVTIGDVSEVEISFAPGSFKPDSVFANSNFSISFDIDINGDVPMIDTSFVTIELLKQNDTAVLSEIFNNFISPVEISEDQIRYANLTGRIVSETPYSNGYYPIRVSYYFITGNNIISFTEAVDSLYVFFENGLSLVEGSLIPKIVYAGENVSFEFKVKLQSSLTFDYYEATSTFRLYDENYSTSTNLFLESDHLYPGENMLRSAAISIQPNQLGSELYAEASFRFSIPGINDTLEFKTVFTDASLPILVYSAPVVQIIDLEINAPNSPKVNTDQQLTMTALIANVSEQPVTELDLQLVTVNGASSIENPQQMISTILPHDTATVIFNVTASSEANLLPESFRVDILSTNVTQIPPLNNSAYLFIEKPASLELSYRVNGISNVEELIVNHSDLINLSFRVLNVGTAKTTNGEYELNITGLAGGDINYAGSLIVDSLLDFSFSAPAIDTVLIFDFRITEIPVDVNSDTPTEIDRDSLRFRIAVLSDETELTVESKIVNSNLVNPDVQKRFVDVTFNNSGASLLNDIEVNKIEFSLFDVNYSEIDVRSVLNIGRSGFYEGDLKLTNATTGGNKVTFWFDEFIVPVQQKRTISLLFEFKESAVSSIILESFVNQIGAVYYSGSNTGLPVSVKTVSGSEEFVSIQIVIKGSTLDESFVISDNPFNPEDKPALFSYQLPDDGEVEFRIFTLTGEEVFAKIIPAGQEGAQQGENMLEWNGKNNSGHMVLNGVYIVSILNTQTGEYTRKKIALVK